jgi:hypothetical protein
MACMASSQPRVRKVLRLHFAQERGKLGGQAPWHDADGKTPLSLSRG